MCPVGFDARAALDQTSLGRLVTLDPNATWLDKYVVSWTSETWLLCYGVHGRVTPGLWPMGGDIYSAWVAGGEDVELCCGYDRVMKESVYCDTTSDSMIACEGSLPNATFFATMGVVGQDCQSWAMLSSLLSGEISAATVAAACEAACDGKMCKLPLRKGERVEDDDPEGSFYPARFHALSDAHPYESPAWMAKYVVGRRFAEVLRCSVLNTANLVGDWAVDSPFVTVWRGADAESDVRRACKVVEATYNTYDYCDAEANTTLICDAKPGAAEYIATYGVVGQDCKSWTLMIAVLTGEIGLGDVSGHCKGTRQLGKAGCQEDTTVGLTKPRAIGGYDYFASRFVSTNPTLTHYHHHYWNSDSIYDEYTATTPTKWLRSHPGFVPCLQNYADGSTWNRPQVCVKSGQANWYVSHRAAFASPAQAASEQHGGTRWPILNYATRMTGTIEANYVSKGPVQYLECQSSPKPSTSGFVISPQGSWCTFRAVSDTWSTGAGRSSLDRNICQCVWSAVNFNNDASVHQPISCPQ